MRGAFVWSGPELYPVCVADVREVSARLGDSRIHMHPRLIYSYV